MRKAVIEVTTTDEASFPPVFKIAGYLWLVYRDRGKALKVGAKEQHQSGMILGRDDKGLYLMGKGVGSSTEYPPVERWYGIRERYWPKEGRTIAGHGLRSDGYVNGSLVDASERPVARERLLYTWGVMMRDREGKVDRFRYRGVPFDRVFDERGASAVIEAALDVSECCVGDRETIFTICFGAPRQSWYETDALVGGPKGLRWDRIKAPRGSGLLLLLRVKGPNAREVERLARDTFARTLQSYGYAPGFVPFPRVSV